MFFSSYNAHSFLFDEIRYEIGGEHVAMVRKPGDTTTLKTMVSFRSLQQRSLMTCGWGLDEAIQDIVDTASNVFSGKLLIKYFMGFAEEYTKGVFNVKQELIMIIARTSTNCYVGEVHAEISIDKIESKVRHIIPDDKPALRQTFSDLYNLI